jgi:hypothetical protein
LRKEPVALGVMLILVLSALGSVPSFWAQGSGTTQFTTTYTTVTSGPNAKIVFVEIGLPPYYGWGVTFGGQPEFANFTSITFNDPPGTYGYNVSAQGPGYFTNTTSGSINVNYGFSESLGELMVNASSPPGGLGYDPSNGYLYLSQPRTGNVLVVEDRWVIADLSFPTQNVSGWDVAPSLQFFAYDTQNQLMYTAGQNSSYVFALNGTSTQASIPVSNLIPKNFSQYFSQFAGGIAYNPSNNLIYVTHPHSNNITLIKGTQVVGNISVGAETGGIAYDNANGYTYVSELNPAAVLVFNGTKVVGNVSLGSSSYPISLGVNQKTGWVYVADFGTPAIHIITGTTLFSTVSESSYSVNVGFDPVDNYTYITYEDPTGGIQAWNYSNVVATIPDASGSYGISFDGTLGYMVSTNIYNGFVWEVAEGSVVVPIYFSPQSSQTTLHQYTQNQTIQITNPVGISTTNQITYPTTDQFTSNKTSGFSPLPESTLVLAALISGVVIASFGVAVVVNRKR